MGGGALAAAAAAEAASWATMAATAASFLIASEAALFLRALNCAIAAVVVGGRPAAPSSEAIVVGIPCGRPGMPCGPAPEARASRSAR